LGNVAGREYDPVAVTIEAPRVEAFARAIGADPAAGVPPTFAAVYALAATAPRLFADPEAAVDFGRLLHAEQEFEWERPVRVGETLNASGRVVSDQERRGNRFLRFESRCTDAEGRPVCTGTALFIVRSADA
jgi:acyl dehydratase